VEAMDKVIQTFKSHDIPKLIPHVLSMHTLRTGWILRWKFKNGIFEKSKARPFTRRNHREPGIDYNRSFLPVMSLEYPRTSRRSLDSSTYWLGSRMRESRVRSPLLTFEYSSTDATSATYPEPPFNPSRISMAKIQVDQSHLVNHPLVHSSLIGASLPPVHARKPPISSALGSVQQ